MSAPTRIAVIADTHDRLPPHILPSLADADEIWHLGDVCSPALLEKIAQLGPPLRIVRGNCDDCLDWSLTLDFQLAGHRIHLVHIPTRTAPAGCDLLLHGHTHVPRDEMVGTTRFLNPGCITRPNLGAPASYARLELSPDTAPKWELRLVRPAS